jgi:hypothetical protein
MVPRSMATLHKVHLDIPHSQRMDNRSMVALHHLEDSLAHRPAVLTFHLGSCLFVFELCYASSWLRS